VVHNFIAAILFERLADPACDRFDRFLPGDPLPLTGATFADAAPKLLRYCEQDRGCKPSTLRDY